MTLTGFFLVSSVQTGGAGGSLTPLVDFYSKLPKGPAPQSNFGGLKARYFTGKNASAAPILATILGIFAVGYTIDYQSAFRPTTALALTVLELTLTIFFGLFYLHSHDLIIIIICGPVFTLCTVHLSASPLTAVFALWNGRN